MAQNLVINGVTYNSVNSLSIPKSAGGNATFPDTSDATAVAANILSGKTAYAKGVKVTGNIQSKSAQTYTPTTSNQTISSGQYLSGAQTVLGDADLVAGNIKKDVQIFGVTGSYQGSGGNLQSKSVTYTSNGTAKVTPDAGYDALSEVSVTVDVSGGGGVETCTLTIAVDNEPGGNNNACVYATTPDGAQSYSVAGTYIILKNSVLVAYSQNNISGSYQALPYYIGSGETILHIATGNLTVYLRKGL